jgi:hypothetical protein
LALQEQNSARRTKTKTAEARRRASWDQKEIQKCNVRNIVLDEAALARAVPMAEGPAGS